MTRETLLNLRMEICLCSLYYTDFRNSFGIDEHTVCDFFDGYADYLEELMNGIRDHGAHTEHCLEGIGSRTQDRKSTRQNSSHIRRSRMPSSA